MSSLGYKVRYFNLIKGEKYAVHSLKNGNLIIIKETVKESAVFIRNREDYLKDQLDNKNQLDDKNVDKELTGDVEGTLEKIIKTVLKKVRDRGDFNGMTLHYFLVNKSKLGRLYLLPKIHKRPTCVRATRYIQFRILYGKHFSLL